MTDLSQADERLREARETLAGFITKRADHEQKIAALGRERSVLAFDAHRGDPKARKRLDVLHLEAAKADSEFLSIDSAVSTAQSRVRDAEAAQRAAVDRQNTAKALILVDGLRAQGRHLDEALAATLEAYDELKRRVRELRSLGTYPVSEANMQLALKVAMESALIHTDMELPLHPPGQRHSFAQLTSSWASNVEATHRHGGAA
jgi:hypothetical protein